jgi:hypothetical protein
MTETPARPPPVVTYWAISILNSRTFRINAVLLFVTIVPLLADPELVALISPRYLVLYAAAVKILNIYLRTITTRPVAFIPPGDTAPVEVVKVGPPDPPVTASTD